VGDAVIKPILACSDKGKSRLAVDALQAGWHVETLGDIGVDEAMQVALVEVEETHDMTRLRRRHPLSLFVDSRNSEPREQVDLVFDAVRGAGFVPQFLRHARRFWMNNRKVSELVNDVDLRKRRMHQLNEISMALTGNVPQQKLLHTILSEARRIASCEAGSLFLVEKGADQSEALVFKLAQNDAVDFPYLERRLALSSDSIAGYVAATGTELNIRDVYQLADGVPYQFNRSFDDSMGYRTKSVLAIPMRDHRGEVVGVLQFLNQLNPNTGEVEPFSEETAEILRAIASQAAVSIQKNELLQDVHRLFEGFVQASVKTIEQRDPSTSGHSFRVAETTVALLEALPQSGVAQFRGLSFSAEHIREVRYAALLHDFGKVGVPEAILLKANKLNDERIEVLRYRIELQKERLRRKAVEREIDLLHHAPVDQDVARRRVHRQLEKELSVLDQYFDWIEMANRPNVLDAGDFEHLSELREYAFEEFNGEVGGVISDADLSALSARRGSLTPEERRIIENHVVFTKEFLAVLPWPPELANVPQIAAAHHERLDGSGYPLGLVGEQIPLASRVMAVCDVYDALTAVDRPYKAAMSEQQAFTILHEEAKRGLLDADMVDIFIASGSCGIARAG